jgi:intracellular sulfur oxidation DsrE/DsrF family protein
MNRRLLGTTLMLAVLSAQAIAKPRIHPIAGYGKIAPLTGYEGRADPAVRYRVIFNVTKAAPSPDMANPALDKVARLLNLLARDRIYPAKGDVVVVIHGAATPIVANSGLYAAKTNVAINPNLTLIRELREAGVTIAVCSQALHGQQIKPGDVATGVRIDLSAMTTLVALQARGWAILPD